MKFFNEQKTSWELNGEKVSIELGSVQNAKYFEKSNLIGYLVGDEKRNPDKLVVYSPEAKFIQEVTKPNGYQFGYLTTHPEADIAVVCGVIDLEKSNEKWSDFYFGLDLKNGTLSKLGIAR